MQELKLIGKDQNLKPITRGGCNFLQFDKGKYIVIGGVNRQNGQLQELNDFWILHLPHNDKNIVGIWEELKLENQEIFTPRSSQAACISTNGNIYIFGGQKFLQSQSTNEFFVIDPIKRNLKIQNSKNTPYGRNSHTLTFHDEKLYLFGGADDNGPLNDLQIFDLKTETWSKVSDISDILIGREMHTAHILKLNTLQIPKKQQTNEQQQKIVSLFSDQQLNFDEQNSKQENITSISIKNQEIEQQQQILNNEDNQQQDQYHLIIIGGRHNDTLLKDITAINLQTYEINQIENMETPLCAHTSVQQNENIYIFGGFNGTQLNQNIYRLQQNIISKQGSLQTAIMASSALYSKELNKIIIFGGCTLESDLNNTYVVSI